MNLWWGGRRFRDILFMPWALAVQLSSSCPGRGDGTAEFLSFWGLEFSHFSQLPLLSIFTFRAMQKFESCLPQVGWSILTEQGISWAGALDWAKLRPGVTKTCCQISAARNFVPELSPGMSCREPGPFSDCTPRCCSGEPGPCRAHLQDTLQDNPLQGAFLREQVSSWGQMSWEGPWVDIALPYSTGTTFCMEEVSLRGLSISLRCAGSTETCWLLRNCQILKLSTHVKGIMKTQLCSTGSQI